MAFSCKSHRATLAITLLTTTLLNLALWRFVWQNIHPQNLTDILFLISLPIFIFSILNLLYSLLIWPYINKIIIPIFLIIAAVTNYVMFNLGVFIDSDMIRNVIQTNSREAGDLVTISGIFWVLILGILPAFMFVKLKINWQTPWKEIRSHLILISISALVTLSVAGVFYKEYAAFGRNNKEMIRLINPTSVANAIKGYIKGQMNVNRQYVLIDPDAQQEAIKDEHPFVFVIIVGETARSMNFSLNGYPRETNPKLAKQDIINFPNVSSCGTATAISVPCMFSNMGRENFDTNNAAYTENVLELIFKTGVDVLWKDNDDGCKGVCTRIPTIDMVSRSHPTLCNANSCFDEVLIDDFDDYLSKITKDTVVVLHAMGSHGPTYYKRYPPEFKKFTPTCDTAEIQSCSRESIINTYDNTILYTDHFISSAIDVMKKYKNLESGLLYISDHGESLGENGTYLHGLPYVIAPKEQTSVPMILWLSETMKRDDNIDYACLKENANTQKFSQDNLFHSLLGVTEVNSKLYNKDLDIFSKCRTKALF